jgi:hypothetical protein
MVVRQLKGLRTPVLDNVCSTILWTWCQQNLFNNNIFYSKCGRHFILFKFVDFNAIASPVREGAFKDIIFCYFKAFLLSNEESYVSSCRTM